MLLDKQMPLDGEPYLVFDTSEENFLDPADTLDVAGAPHYQLGPLKSIVRRLNSIFTNLWHLSRFLDVQTPENTTDMMFPDAVYCIQRCTMFTLAESKQYPDQVYRSCCTAGLIYVESFLRDVKPNSRIVSQKPSTSVQHQ